MFWLFTVGTAVMIIGWALRRSTQPAAPPAQFRIDGNVLVVRAQSLELPTVEGRVQVPSESQPGVLYDVDLGSFTCSCPDHAKRRAAHPARDVRRCCKHIGGALLRHSVMDGHELLRSVVDGGVRDEEVGLMPVDLPHPVAVGYSGGEWASVWTRGRKHKGAPGAYGRYGWSFTEERWSYGKAPPGAAKILAVLSTMKRA